MESLIRFILGDINIWSPLIVLALGLYKSSFAGCKRAAACASMLQYFMLLTIGLMGSEGFIMHAFFSEFTARLIGWHTSPFQFEVAIANLSFSVLGILAFFKRSYPFSCATVLGFAIWLFGDGLGHVYQRLMLGNTAPFNAGATMYTDLLLPIMGLVLLVGAKYAVVENKQ